MATSTHKKETRARSWANGRERKRLRIAAQDAREAQNRKRRAGGEALPWEKACALRAERRAHLHAIWVKAHPDLAAQQRK